MKRSPKESSASPARVGTDNRTLFYTVEDEHTKRSHRLYRHTLGFPTPTRFIYEENDERFRIQIERTRSGAYSSCSRPPATPPAKSTTCAAINPPENFASWPLAKTPTNTTSTTIPAPSEKDATSAAPS